MKSLALHLSANGFRMNYYLRYSTICGLIVNNIRGLVFMENGEASLQSRICPGLLIHGKPTF
jgi:hypothetical protein